MLFLPLVSLATLMVASTPPPSIAIVGVMQHQEEQAKALLGALGQQPRVNIKKSNAPSGVFFVATTPSSQTPLTEARTLLQRMHTQYAALQPKSALSIASQAQALLAPLLHRDGAKKEMAQLLRLRGLVELFLGQRTQSDMSFVTASHFEPTFQPDPSAWPPAARLAYGDAVAFNRSRAPGVLSVRIQPSDARVYLDGNFVGIGSLTQSNLSTGRHFIMAQRAGFAPMAVTMTVAGSGELSDGSIFLEAVPSQRRKQTLLQIYDPHIDRTYGSKMLCAELGIDAVVIMDAPQGTASLFDADGNLKSSGLLGTPASIAEAVVVALTTHAVARTPVAVAPSPKWYERWEVWAITGGIVAAATGTIMLIATTHKPNDRVDLVIGRTP